MDKKIAQFIMKMAEEGGMDSEQMSLREDYSGRCMYGEDTCAIETKSSYADDDVIAHALIGICYILEQGQSAEIQDQWNDIMNAGDDEEQWPQVPSSIRSDNMGLGMVFY